MKNEELKGIAKKLIDILEPLVESKENFRFSSLMDFAEYDLSEIVDTITETSSIEDIRNLLKKLRRITGIQKMINNEVVRNASSPLLGYEKVGNPTITNRGNYYSVYIDAFKKPVWSFATPEQITLCTVYDKKGNVLLPLDKNNKEVWTLDENNFLICPQDNTKKIQHYRVNNGIEKISEWDFGSLRCMSSWSDKGLINITLNNRIYLYSYLEGKVLSHGFTSLEVFENFNEENEIDYIKEYDCCVVTLDLSSNLPCVEGDYNPNVSTTMLGYMNESGQLIYNMINMSNGEIYPASRGMEESMENKVIEELNVIARENLEKHKLLDKNKLVMIKALKEKNN